MKAPFSALANQPVADDHADAYSATRVSLSVGGCRNTQAELDHLADKVQQEALMAKRPSMRLEEMVKLLAAEKAEFVQELLTLLREANIDLNQPLHFLLNGQQLEVAPAPKSHPQANQINYLFAQTPKLTHAFMHLEAHTRAVEMGRMATAAYGEWKQHQDPSIARNVTRSALYQLQNMSGGTLQHNSLRLLLEGQAQRQLSFNRKFSFA